MDKRAASHGDYDEQDRRAKGTELFVGGLPRSATEGTLREVFSPCGEIVDLRIMKDQNGISKGYGFVRFAERECAYIAKRQKNGSELQGRRLAVDLSLDQDTLFIGNLCKEWSVEEFEELIHKTFKDVVSVDLAMASNLDSSVSKRRLNRGFAFVRFSSHAAAARVLRIGSRGDFLLGGLHPAINWAEKESHVDADEMAKIKTAFVGNLPANVNEEYLKKLFEHFGEVVRVAIARKGQYPVGFVHFASRAELDNAIKEMDGKTVRGPDRGPAFRIQVSVARPAVENDKKRIREEVKTRGSNVSRDRPDNSYGRYGHDSFDRQAKAPRLSNVALIQMEDLASAVSVLQYYTTIQPSVRGRNVYLQFSSHQELTTDQSSHGRNPDQEEPNRILLVTVHHMLYPITVEVLHQVFSSYGFVEKIVTFQKTAGFQALIQYQSRQSAIQASGALHGRNIYDGCCQLDIQYSNLSELQVHYNNDRSRDFTNPSLPTEQRARSSQQGYTDPSGLFGFQQPGAPFAQMGKAAMIAAAFGGTLPPGVIGTNDRCTLIVSNLNTDKIDEDKLFNLFSMYGNIVRIKILRNKPDHALVQMADGLQAELAVHYLKGAMLLGKKLEVNFSKYPTITPAPDAHDYSNSNLNRFNSNVVKNYRHCCAPTKMIHISALPQEISEDAILTHVGEHGTIVNSRLFEANGKTQALVLFESEEEATEALVSKHASKLEGSTIRISFSQMQNI